MQQYFGAIHLQGWFSSQFNGIGDGCQCLSNRLNLDSAAFAIVTCPDPCSKSCDNDDFLDIATAIKEWVHFKGGGVGSSVFPVFLMCFVVAVHNSMLNGFPHRQDITLQHISAGRMHSFQKVFCGSGKCCEKISRNDLLVLVKAESQKDLDAKSAILLLSPLMCLVSSGAALLMC